MVQVCELTLDSEQIKEEAKREVGTVMEALEQQVASLEVRVDEAELRRAEADAESERYKQEGEGAKEAAAKANILTEEVG